MDFRSFTAIGEHLHDPSIHLKNGSGYDHNYILKKPDGKLCARVYSPTSRILLDCRTTEPGAAVLYRQLFVHGQHPRQGRGGLCRPQRLLSGDPALPERDAAPAFPVGGCCRQGICTVR